jgi:hypothetical protein
MKIKLFIIRVTEKSPIYYNESCRARAGKLGDDDIKICVSFYKGLFMMPIYKEKLIIQHVSPL